MAVQPREKQQGYTRRRVFISVSSSELCIKCAFYFPSFSLVIYVITTSSQQQCRQAFRIIKTQIRLKLSSVHKQNQRRMWLLSLNHFKCVFSYTKCVFSVNKTYTISLFEWVMISAVHPFSGVKIRRNRSSVTVSPKGPYWCKTWILYLLNDFCCCCRSNKWLTQRFQRVIIEE